MDTHTDFDEWASASVRWLVIRALFALAAQLELQAWEAQS